MLLFKIVSDLLNPLATSIACAAVVYLLVALWCVARLPLRRKDNGHQPALTILKPLCGAEPDLLPCLRTFCQQDYTSPVQLILGLRFASDPAYSIAQQLKTEFPDVDIEVVADAAVHGPNLKVSNLVNMAKFAKHGVFIVSDSDVSIEPDCLKVVAAALGAPEVGAVTCLFRGKPTREGNWVSQLGALFIDGWFLTSAVVDAALSPMSVCYGPITAIRREIIEARGGFGQLSHMLADDTELGHITTREGKRIVLAPMAVDTIVSETGLGSLFAHELRWARTTRALRPAGYVASVVTHALPIALVAFAMNPSLLNGSLLGAVAALRAALLALVDVRLGRASTALNPTPWFLMFREVLYFAVWLAAFADRRIIWRGQQFRIRPGARLARAEGGPMRVAGGMDR